MKQVFSAEKFESHQSIYLTFSCRPKKSNRTKEQKENLQVTYLYNRLYID